MTHDIKQGEMLSTTTVRIVAKDANGSTSAGTGFFYSIGESNNYIPCLITNKHVLETAEEIQIVVSTASLEGEKLDKHATFNIKDVQTGIIYHPDDIDLCALTLLPIVSDLRNEGIDIHTYFFNNRVIPTKEQMAELDALEEVIMVGYPIGLWDRVNNLPLFRRGITATSPKINFNGKKEFLVDMACINGSSGSPVMYLNKQYRTEVGHGIMGYELYLLGVLYAGPTYKIPLMISGNVMDEAVTSIPINIGHVIQAQEILTLEKLILEEVQSLL